MDAKKLSIVSMIAASSCCLPPLILLGLTLIGVGTAGVAGLSSTLGSLKWYILPLAIFGVGLSYWLYFREKKKCSTKACRMVNKGLTKTMLTISTIVVAGFLSWSIYPYVLGATPAPQLTASSSTHFAAYSIDGMTCGGCEIAVNEAIRATALVDSVKSDFTTGKAYVWFKGKPDADLIESTVGLVGYNAKQLTIERKEK
jgi:copper chaperone CopZ